MVKNHLWVSTYDNCLSGRVVILSHNIQYNQFSFFQLDQPKFKLASHGNYEKLPFNEFKNVKLKNHYYKWLKKTSWHRSDFPNLRVSSLLKHLLLLQMAHVWFPAPTVQKLLTSAPGHLTSFGSHRYCMQVRQSRLLLLFKVLYWKKSESKHTTYSIKESTTTIILLN